MGGAGGAGGLGRGRAGEAADFRGSVDEFPGGIVDVWLAGELGANQESVNIRFEGSDGGVIADAGFGDDDGVIGDVPRQRGGAGEVDTEVVKVSVIDTKNVCPQVYGPRHLGFGDDFGEDVQVPPVGFGREGAVFRIGEDAEHEKDGVGTIVAGGPDLDGVDNEVFAEDGKVRGGGHCRQVVVVATEAFGFAEHGDAGCVLGVDLGDRTGVVVGPDEPQGWGCGFAFHDEGIAGVEVVVEASG